MARFMGWKYYGEGYHDNSDRYFHNGAMNLDGDIIECSWDEWAQLIPVIEKMNEFGVWTLRPGFARFESYKGVVDDSRKFSFQKSIGDFETENDEPAEWVFITACVCLDFIKWNNNQNK